MKRTAPATVRRTTAYKFAKPEAAEKVDAAIAAHGLKADMYGFKPDEVKDLLRISLRQVYYLIDLGELRSIKQPSRTGRGTRGKTRVPKAAVVDYVARNLAQASPYADGEPPGTG